jgi:glycosyltransferase involved in cell wall biosynthesis
MKIAIIEPILSLPYGTSRFALSVAAALQKLGHQVVIYTNEFNENVFSGLARGIDIRVARPKLKEEDLRGARTIFGKLLQRWQRRSAAAENSRLIVGLMDKDFDIIDCQNLYTYRVGYLYKKYVNKNAKVIWSLYDVPWIHRPAGRFLHDAPRQLNSYLEEVLEKKFYCSVDKVVLLENRNYPIAKRLGFADSQIFLIPWSGVDEKFYFPVKDIARVKEVRLLSVGALGSPRRYEDIISAVAILKKRKIPTKATIICRVSPDVVSYKEQISRFAESLGVAGDIDFHFAGASDEELREAQRQSYFYVSPNTIGIWSMAAAEAMAAGLVLVVSRVTSNVEVLKDGEHALFSDPGNPVDIADKVDWALKNPKEYERIALAGQRFVKENFTWEKYAEKFLKTVGQ